MKVVFGSPFVYDAFPFFIGDIFVGSLFSMKVDFRSPVFYESGFW